MERASLPDEVMRLMPLTPAVFYILLSLAAGARHGYAIMQESRTLSSGRFHMGPATLYSTIQKLVGLSLIHETEGSGVASGEDSRRRYYALTDTGRQLLQAEVAHMNSVVLLADARLTPRVTES
jgi:DNA-binding PadR family transcriptional regulator